MFDEDGYSDHILDNLTPEEELALSLFQQALFSGKPKALKKKFKQCLKLADALTKILIVRHAEVEASSDPRAKFKVIHINKDCESTK